MFTAAAIPLMNKFLFKCENLLKDYGYTGKINPENNKGIEKRSGNREGKYRARS